MNALWLALRGLVLDVGRRLIGKLVRGIAKRWAYRRIIALRVRADRVRAQWRKDWIAARIKVWRRVWTWASENQASLGYGDLCECRREAQRLRIPMDSPDDVEPRRAPRRAA